MCVCVCVCVCDLQLWDLDSTKKVADLCGHLSWVHGVQFSPDGTMLLSCSDDHTVRVSPPLVLLLLCVTLVMGWGCDGDVIGMSLG